MEKSNGIVVTGRFQRKKHVELGITTFAIGLEPPVTVADAEILIEEHAGFGADRTLAVVTSDPSGRTVNEIYFEVNSKHEDIDRIEESFSLVAAGIATVLGRTLYNDTPGPVGPGSVVSMLR